MIAKLLTFGILRALLDFSYVIFLIPVFGYAGFSLNVHLMGYAASWLLFLGAASLISSSLSKLSDYFFVAFVAAYLAPLSSYYGLSGAGLVALIVSFASFLYCLGGTQVRIFRGNDVFPAFPKAAKISRMFAWVGVFFLAAWYVVSGAAYNFNLDFSKVYEFRYENAALANRGLLAYLNPWIYQICTMYLLAHALVAKRYSWIAPLLAVQVFFFGVSTHKSLLFYPLLVLMVWWWFKDKTSLLIFPLVYSIVLALSLVSYLITDDILLASMFVRRVFFVPAILTDTYFDFIAENSYVFWSNSIFEGMIEYPYHDRITKMIGYELSTEASANNGFVSAGYAHAGLIGVFVYSSLILVLLRVLDRVRFHPQRLWVPVALMIVPLRAVILSSDLFTALLTHGMFLACIFVFVSGEGAGVATRRVDPVAHLRGLPRV